MDIHLIPADRYFQQLRALGAWWRLGSSVLEPQLLVEPIPEEAAHAASDVRDYVVTDRVSTPDTSPLRMA
jgi:hypothetical protein